MNIEITKLLVRKFAHMGLAICLVGLAFLALTTSTEAKGKKYGLFIGVGNYAVDSLGDGPGKDAQNWKKMMIERFGFAESNTVILVDGDATREGIIKAIRSFYPKATEGDLFVVTYSGHGTLFPDRHSPVLDEKEKVVVDLMLPGKDGKLQRTYWPLDFYDSAIVPFDAGVEDDMQFLKNLILDDEMFVLLGPFATKGAKVVFISDSCHSGTIAKGDVGNGEYKARFFDPRLALGEKGYQDVKTPADQKKAPEQSSEGFYLTISAAQDDQVAWGGKDGGLFTFSAMLTFEELGSRAVELNYASFFERIRSLVEYASAKTPSLQSPNITTYSMGDPEESFGEKIFQP